MSRLNKYLLGDLLFAGIRSMGPLHRWVNSKFVSALADSGPLPGAYTTRGDGETSLHELLKKEYFSLEVPKPSQDQLNQLPDTQTLLPLFKR